jgi:hypothetical protein
MRVYCFDLRTQSGHDIALAAVCREPLGLIHLERLQANLLGSCVVMRSRTTLASLMNCFTATIGVR